MTDEEIEHEALEFLNLFQETPYTTITLTDEDFEQKIPHLLEFSSTISQYTDFLEKIGQAKEVAWLQKIEIAEKMASYDRTLARLQSAQEKLHETGKMVDEKHNKIRSLLSSFK